ncbi:hypothetical protein Ahy_B08g093422 [Arachis hypogaea]|uniref:Vesicle transport v-SNARE N-terminal domain-containing protein n=1 Tax=Arachis hypogaea TaxID=3818 RepID=A0A444Y622_ARAHY|nr:hypothetical protein Ahy_B08g093422 [Arachis hypogaea]
MKLEARSLQANMKASLLIKLREYKTDLNNLKSEPKRITSAANNNNDELLELGQADTLAVGEQEKHDGNRGAWCLHPPRFASATLLHGVDDNIDESKKILTAISKRMSRNKWILGSFMVAIVLAIILITFD